MYILQICNISPEEILLQQQYESPYNIEKLIESAQNWREWFIYDDKRGTLKGYYAHHTIMKEKDDTIYKVFFNIGLARLPKVEQTCALV